MGEECKCITTSLERWVGLSENISQDILEEIFHYMPQETQYDISTYILHEFSMMIFFIISLKIYQEKVV